MRFRLSYIVVIFLSLSEISLFAQEVVFMSPSLWISPTSGATLTTDDIEMLRNVDTIAIRYDYKDMRIADFKTEAKYLEHILKKKGKEKGNEYIENWKRLPKTHFERYFENGFAEKIAKLNIVAINDTNTMKTSLLVKVIKMKPDYHNEVVDKTFPSVRLSCTFYSSKKELFNFIVYAETKDKPDVATRLSECYLIAGGILARKIVRQLKPATTN